MQLSPISVTASVVSITVATSLLYIFYKKQTKKNAAKKRTRIETSRQTVLEIKIPKQCIPAIIGRNGAKIKSLQEDTQTQVRFQEDSKLELSEKICTIRGQPANVRLAEDMIRCIIANQPQIDTYEELISNRFISILMGRGGQNVSKIQMDTQAKIKVEGNSYRADPNGKTKVTIRGTADQISNALIEIEKKVEECIDAELKSESIETLKSRGKSPSKSPVSEHNSDGLMSNLDMNEEIEVFVTSMESPNKFFVQIVGSLIQELDELTEKMTEYYDQEENREMHRLKNITEGQLVVVKFTQDNRWYRAKILERYNDNKCEAFFVDFGDYQITDESEVFEIRTDFLTLRHQAIECALAHIKSRGQEWSEAALDRFETLANVAQWTKKLSAKIKGMKKKVPENPSLKTSEDGNAVLQIDLLSHENGDTVNIGLELRKEGFAVYDNCSDSPSSRLESSNQKTSPNEETESKANSSDIQSFSDLSD